MTDGIFHLVLVRPASTSPLRPLPSGIARSGSRRRGTSCCLPLCKRYADCLFLFEANLSPSTTTLHPLLTFRESILSIWPSAAQSHRSQPDASAQELFVLLYGMLFTNIQLNDFIPTLARFLLGAAREGLVRVVTKCSPFIYYEDVRKDRQMDVDDESSRVLFALPHVSPALSLAAYVFNVVIRSP